MIVRRVDSRDLYPVAMFLECPQIQDLCEQSPHTWIWEDPPAHPAGHFGSLFAARTMRRYDNPVIACLSSAHEHTHDVTFPYNPELDYDEWFAGMIESESIASLHTEALIYLWIKDLRRHTFDHEIWVDRFLRDPKFMKKHPLAQAAEITVRRDKVYNDPRKSDLFEAQIHSYYEQNQAWCRIWAEPVGYGDFRDEPAYCVVDRHMSSPDRDATHLEWLKAVSAPNPFNGGEPIPFLNQAVAFEPLYQKTLYMYGNGIFKKRR